MNKYNRQPISLIKNGLVVFSLLGGLLSLGGCGGTEDSSSPASLITVNSAAAIAQESDADYNNNVNGLITGATLKAWKDDWLTNRPAGITGKLIIFQATTGTVGAEYVAPNNLNVFTYLSPSSEWVQTRSNGVISTVSMVPDGATMDALFKTYNVDPSHDMIVCAQGTGSTGNAMAQGRCWYALRYWGVAADHLALLNGSNDWQVTNGDMTAGDFAASASSAPSTGTASVRDLPQDNTQLQATVEDMLNIVTATDANDTTDGVFIWDARNASQFGGTGYQNNGSSQGHPNGALLLGFDNLLDGTQGYRYKDKVTLQAYLDGSGATGFVDGAGAVAAGDAYQDGDVVYTYCETTFRAMITGVASGVILGKPTRFYDGAMYEWHSLAYLQDATGNYLLPADSPWRTDLTSVSFFTTAAPASVATRVINDAYALHADAIIRDDKAYKAGTSSSASATDAELPVNPCGG